MLLTCAHVINDCLDGRHVEDCERPEDPVTIEFSLPFSSKGKTYHAELMEWYGPRSGQERTDNPVNDIALLKVLDKLPGDIRIVSPDAFKVTDLEGKLVSAFGFSNDNGEPASGELTGVDGGGWISFAATSDLKSFVAPGFSGAPLFDEGKNTILGMVVAMDDGNGRVAFAQPTKHLWQACPQIARPYKGLRDFEEVDAPFFFGRNKFIGELTQKAGSCPIIGVSAASGAGKSSVIKAGLIPKLRIDGRSLILQMRPGRDPWAALAKVLAELKHPNKTPLKRIDDEEEIYSKLIEEAGARSAVTLQGYAEAALAEDGYADRLFIYVDQLEELFTLAGHKNAEEGYSEGAPSGTEVNGDTRLPDFRSLIADTADLTRAPRIQWCYSIRADFLGKLIPHRAFNDCLGEGEVRLSEMTAQELRDAISKPAEELNVVFEDHVETGENLADRLADDAGKNEGVLPLLEHVLEQIWQGMRERKLTHAAYDELGGLGGALDRYADKVTNEAFKNQTSRLLLRKLFFRLIEPGESGDATRRIVSRKELGDNDLWHAAVILADARLLVVRSGSEVGSEDHELDLRAVEVAHEALIEHWKQLSAWIADNRAFLKWAKRLRDDLERWIEDDRSNAYLLQEGALQEALSRLEDWREFLNKEEIGYIDASRQQTEREREERERVLQQKLKAEEVARKLAEDRQLAIDSSLREAKKSRNRSRVAACVLVVALIATSIGGYFLADALEYAEQQRRLAEVQRDHADLATTRALFSAKMAEQQNQIAEAALKEAESERVRAETATQQAVEAATNAEIEKSIYAAAIADRLVELDKPLLALKVLKDVVPKSFSDVMASQKKVALAGVAGAFQHLHQDPGRLRGHSQSIIRATFSPKGDKLALASSDNTASIWDTKTGRKIVVLKGHSKPIQYLQFSQDGNLVVTGSRDHTVRIWNTTTGDELSVFEFGGRSIIKVLFSPDSRQIVTVIDDLRSRMLDGAVHVWDVDSGHPKPLFELNTTGATHAMFSPNGALLITTSVDGYITFWNAKTGQEITKLVGHTGRVNYASFSRDGRLVASGGADNTVRIWDTEQKLEIAVLNGHEQNTNLTGVGQGVIFTEFTVDGSKVLSASTDKTARIWNVKDEETVQIFRGHSDALFFASISQDGRRVLTSSWDGTVILWDAETGKKLRRIVEGLRARSYATFSPNGHWFIAVKHESAMLLSNETGGAIAELRARNALAVWADFSNDGQLIVTISDDDTARVWDSELFFEVAALTGHNDDVVHAAFSADGKKVVTASDDRTAKIFNSKTGQEIAVLEGHEFGLTHAEFSPDGTSVVTGSWDNTARLWNAATGHEIAILAGHKDTINRAKFSRDGRLVVTASSDSTARIWSAISGQEIAVLKGHEDEVQHAEFSRNGKLIVTASWDGTAKLWSVETSKELAIFRGHSKDLTYAEFSYDGKYVVTASEDGSARVWEVETGRGLLVLQGHTGGVDHATFSPDGLRILTSGGIEGARIWDANTGLEISNFAQRSPLADFAIFSPDGLRVLTTTNFGNSQLHNVFPAKYLNNRRRPVWISEAPVSQSVLDHLFIQYTGEITCEERREILKDHTC
ncbi:WD40 repeat protein [Labrenzia sp. EL_208]|nr:WD40 repeat protein [Labrenzia sp. EL_132]MBG6228144.1 WD40 repeat protein [Labrenzia sp. EL_208]